MDGNLNDNYNSGSCTATSGCNQCLPWWAVDFGTVKSVFEIQITNRGDAHSKSSLVGGKILVQQWFELAVNCQINRGILIIIRSIVKNN